MKDQLDLKNSIKFASLISSVQAQLLVFAGGLQQVLLGET